MFGLRKWLRSKYLAPHPLTLSNRKMAILINEKKVCPDCGEWDFNDDSSMAQGPTYIKCANCGSWFHDRNTVEFERVFKSGNIDWRKWDKYRFCHYKNYNTYTWSIINSWHKVEMPTHSIDNIVDAVEWFGTEMSPSNMWSIKDSTVYFKKEEDAMAFKLRWL